MMDPAGAFLKNLRLYQISLLHYPVNLLISCVPGIESQHLIDALTHGTEVLFQILILIHYLGCCWIYIGSARFADLEENHVPWTLANDDFKHTSNIELIIFADTWVSTVVTTVGYGDYTGSTSLELGFTIAIEFFGFLIFAVLMIAISKVLGSDSSYGLHL